MDWEKAVQEIGNELMQFVFLLQFNCCGVDDNGYEMYLKNANATAFPQSCCEKGNGTCPKTTKQANKVDPKVFKKTVRKSSKQN